MLDEMRLREEQALKDFEQRFRERAGELVDAFILTHAQYGVYASSLRIQRKGATREAICTCSWYRPNFYQPAALNEQGVACFGLRLPKFHPQMEWLSRLGVDEALDRLITWAHLQVALQKTLIATAPPLTDKDLCPLRKLARARREAWSCFDQMVMIEEPPDGSVGGKEWESAVKQRVAMNFPRDAQGKLSLKTVVPLQARNPEVARFQRYKRTLWYVAAGPERRRDPQVIRVCYQWVYSQNQNHNWENVSDCWNPQSSVQNDPQRVDLAGLPWERLGLANREDNLAVLREDTSEAGRIARTILFQDAGRLGDALAEWNLMISEDVQELLAGDGAADMVQAFRRAFQRMALWQIGPILGAEGQRLQEWRSLKNGRRKRPPVLTLFSLPHETRASWVCLMVSSAPDATARFYLQSTASEARLPRELWERPVEIDLKRFGLWENRR